MSFFELYVTPTGSATNGGSGTGAPKESETLLSNVDAVQTAGVTHTLENKNNTGWGTTAVNDWICFDTAGAKKLCVVSALAVGGDTDVIEVKSLTGTGSFAAMGKGVRVGGAWNLPSVGVTFLNGVGATNWNSAGLTAPPRLNIKTANVNGSENIDYTETASINSTATWNTTDRFLTLSGYSSVAGDLDPWTTNDRVVIDFGANDYYMFFGALGNLHVVQNVYIKSTGALGTLISNGGSTISQVVLHNVKFEQLNANANRFGVNLSSPMIGKCIRCHGTVHNSINNSVFEGCTTIGCFATSNGKTQSLGYVGCISIACVAKGLATAFFGSGGTYNCSVFDCVTAFSALTVWGPCINNKIQGCTDAFIQSGHTHRGMTIGYNEFFNNTDNFDSSVIQQVSNNFSGSASLFVDAANNNFQPSATSPGLNAGFGNLPLASNANSYPDVGAIQLLRTGGGGVPLIGRGGLVY